jgi:hypothetical protein
MKNKTTSSIRQTLTALLLAGSLLFSSGCWLFVAGAAAGAAAVTVAYVDGTLTADYAINYDHVVAATRLAITQLQFAKPEEQADALSATFNTDNARGDHIKIVVSRRGDNSTRVVIRVGAFGDEMISMAINDKIKADL